MTTRSVPTRTEDAGRFPPKTRRRAPGAAFLLVAALCLASAASGQVGLSVVADGDWVVNPAPSTTPSVADGTPVDPDLSLVGTTATLGTTMFPPPLPCAAETAIGRADAIRAITATGASIRFQASATLFVNSSCSGPTGVLSAGFRGSVLCTFSSPTPVDGVLRIEVRNILPSTAGTPVLIEDLENSTTYAPRDLRPGGPEPDWIFEFPARLDSSGHQFRINLDVGNLDSTVPGIGGAPLAYGAVSFETDPNANRIRTEGTPCSGTAPRLRGLLTRYFDVSQSLTVRFAGFSTENISPTTTGHYLILGLSDPMAHLPPTNCLLRTDILAPIPLIPSANGRADFLLELVPGLPIGELRAQFLAVELIGGVPHWETSEAVVVSTR
ncbi:MAG: hypothetical protein AAF196_09565 [Planctomycetota bacterium]